ncbi:S-adenosylmethionine-dependent methyltransferase protein [Rutstroemia sp. NJR-2017a WRK4]|nr:S-adenosylmethionine-dependent methyltransferase protein [Rutstroemia sp. NJR-2017a WRK4]
MEPEASKISHLEPSALGTKEYWDNLYNLEISNHTLDSSDIGTIWFDDSSAEDKVVEFLNEEVVGGDLLELGLGGERETRAGISVLDLGTGNGHFLIRLRDGEEDDEDDEDGEEFEGDGQKKKWTGRLMGVDYSEKSIEFARRISATEKEGEQDIEWTIWDIMKESPEPKVLNGQQARGWDVVVDKGTFDAISLSEETDEQGRRICEGYRERVLKLVRRGKVLLVTSCNWTEEELIEWFVPGEAEQAEDGERFEVLRKIEYRSFSFGGRKGQTVCSVCFRKSGGAGV